MMDIPSLKDSAPILLLTAGIGIIASTWGYIKGLCAYLFSFVVVSVHVGGYTEHAVLYFCYNNLKTFGYGNKCIYGALKLIPKLKRHYIVGYEWISDYPTFFWYNKTPFLIKYSKTRISESSYITIMYIRGTLHINNFIKKCLDTFNDKANNLANNKERRYKIYKFTHETRTLLSGATLSNKYENATDQFKLAGTEFCGRFINFSLNDLFEDKESSSLNNLALSQDVEKYIREIEHWIKAREWFVDRNLPWKRGWLLYGEPGCGKSSLSRAIAQHLDLPIYVYDLSTFTNKDLIDDWMAMSINTPCIALIEDIDTVFDGRQNIVKQDGAGITFDCLLNCIDGVETSNGVFTIITTNHVEKIDGALKNRPGRIDRLIYMGKPDLDGKRKICKRILADWPEKWDQILKDSSNDSGAEFQEKCVQLAMESIYKD